MTFTTEAAADPIHDIQGATHRSSLAGSAVTTTGIVTATISNGFYLQDPAADSDDATSEAIFVFTSSAPTVQVGDAVKVSGTVSEFRPGGAASDEPDDDRDHRAVDHRACRAATRCPPRR